MNAVKTAARTGTTMVNRTVAVVTVEPVPNAAGVEIEVSESAVAYGVTTLKVGLQLVFGVLPDASILKRLVWVVPVGEEVSLEAQRGQCLGEVYLMPRTPGPIILAVVFLELQGSAVERAALRRLGT